MEKAHYKMILFIEVLCKNAYDSFFENAYKMTQLISNIERKRIKFQSLTHHFFFNVKRIFRYLKRMPWNQNIKNFFKTKSWSTNINN